MIETVTREAGWGRKLPKGQGLGPGRALQLRQLRRGGGCVEVGTQGELTIPRVDIAFDCGPQVYPDRVRSQLEGAVIMGVSLATLGEITFKNGRAQQDNFHMYQVTRMAEAPRDIRVHLLPATDWSMPLGGVGEPGCRRSRRRSATRSSLRPASVSGSCRSQPAGDDVGPSPRRNLSEDSAEIDAQRAPVSPVDLDASAAAAHDRAQWIVIILRPERSNRSACSPRAGSSNEERATCCWLAGAYRGMMRSRCSKQCRRRVSEEGAELREAIEL